MATDEKTQEAPIDSLSFKEASIELERIVRSLESGDLELEEALARYGRGVELLASLKDRLDNAEQQVQELMETEDVAVPDTREAPSQNDFA